MVPTSAIGAAEDAHSPATRYVAREPRFAERAYRLALEGASGGRRGRARRSGKPRWLRKAEDARQAEDVHQPGEFIDTLDNGPRGSD